VPEAAADGPIGRLQDGDRIVIDAERGLLDVAVDQDILNRRPVFRTSGKHSAYGCGRELFAMARAMVSDAEQGACTLFTAEGPD